MNKSKKYAHFSSTLKSLFSLSRKYETKKNTVKEEWKKLLTFGALGWVKSSQNLGKIGSTSPLTRHGREEKLGQMDGSGGERREELYTGQLSAG